jgi:ribulose-phosphate 3-epimerase
MIHVLPAILENNFESVKEKSDRLKGVVEKAQLDISDGIFVPEESWHEPKQLSGLGNDVLFDLHMMVDKPEQWISEWNMNNIFRFTFHFNATYDVLRTINIIKKTGKEVGVALNLETNVKDVYDILSEIDIVLIMGITPGAQSREFDSRAIDKIKELREHNQKIIIGVDGGVSPVNSTSIIDAGANFLVSGSYIFEQLDIKQAIELLQNK